MKLTTAALLSILGLSMTGFAQRINTEKNGSFETTFQGAADANVFVTEGDYLIFNKLNGLPIDVSFYAGTDFKDGAVGGRAEISIIDADGVLKGQKIGVNVLKYVLQETFKQRNMNLSSLRFIEFEFEKDAKIKDEDIVFTAKYSVGMGGPNFNYNSEDCENCQANKIVGTGSGFLHELSSAAEYEIMENVSVGANLRYLGNKGRNNTELQTNLRTDDYDRFGSNRISIPVDMDYTLRQLSLGFSATLQVLPKLDITATLEYNRTAFHSTYAEKDLLNSAVMTSSAYDEVRTYEDRNIYGGSIKNNFTENNATLRLEAKWHFGDMIKVKNLKKKKSAKKSSNEKAVKGDIIEESFNDLVRQERKEESKTEKNIVADEKEEVTVVTDEKEEEVTVVAVPTETDAEIEAVFSDAEVEAALKELSNEEVEQTVDEVAPEVKPVADSEVEKNEEEPKEILDLDESISEEDALFL